jgi:transcriptional regulator with XRE-family HTH domain
MTTDNSNKLNKSVGEQLREAREKLHLTQLQVAEAAGVSTNYYAQMERNEVNPSVDKVQKVKKILKLKEIKI